MQLGLDVASHHIVQIFEEWDADMSRNISLKELAQVLKSKAIMRPLSHVDLDESPGAPPVADQLKTALAENAVTVIKLFKSWDEDRDGLLSRTEFETGLRALGLDVPSKSIHKLFGEWDKDGSGELSLSELTAVLNCNSAIAALRKHLQARQERLTDVFRLWDEDGDRELTKQEFGKAMASCGLNCDETQLEALFDSIDTDRSGKISYPELNRALRRDPAQEALKARRRRSLQKQVEQHLGAERMIDLKKLRAEVRQEARSVGKRLDDIDDEVRGVAKKKEAVRGDPNLRWKWAKDRQLSLEQAARKAFEKDSMHLRLRLRGTELEPVHSAAGVVAINKILTPSHSRAPTRHGRLPSVPDSINCAAPNVTDILSLHRRSRHTPARRHSRVFLPAVPSPRRSQSELLKLATSPEHMKLCYSTKAKDRSTISRDMAASSRAATAMASISGLQLTREAVRRARSPHSIHGDTAWKSHMPNSKSMPNIQTTGDAQSGNGARAARLI